ncbi:UDP-N-acetylmuramate dehydrogenase [soil metagenome]
MNKLAQLQAKLGDKVTENKDISHFLTLRTKTKAEYYFSAESREDIVSAIKAAYELDISFFMLAGGSNMAVLRDTIEGLMIHNRYFKKEILEDTPAYADVLFSSGYPMSRVVRETTEEGMAGFEYHLGLPGTIGGAIYMNSKWTKPVSYCGDTLISATIVDHQGNMRQVEKEYFEFAYDYSILQKTKEIFLDGVFRLKKEDATLLQERSKAALQYRQETQPHGVSTGGCFFQNITQEDKERANLPTTSAGYLIDHAGLKGKQVGSFVVSDKHANFIVNTGEGKPEDLHELLDQIKSTIKEKYGVELVEEVRVIT